MRSHKFDGVVIVFNSKDYASFQAAKKFYKKVKKAYGSLVVLLDNTFKQSSYDSVLSQEL